MRRRGRPWGRAARGWRRRGRCRAPRLCSLASSTRSRRWSASLRSLPQTTPCETFWLMAREIWAFCWAYPDLGRFLFEFGGLGQAWLPSRRASEERGCPEPTALLHLPNSGPLSNKRWWCFGGQHSLWPRGWRLVTAGAMGRRRLPSVGRQEPVRKFDRNLTGDLT